jgi:hypothetical protein
MLLLVAVFWAASIAIYFLPTIVAAKREHHNVTAIFVLDLLLGWTLIGWVCALVWACTQTYSRGYQAQRGELPPRWSAEYDRAQWSARDRGERTPSRW